MYLQARVQYTWGDIYAKGGWLVDLWVRQVTRPKHTLRMLSLSHRVITWRLKLLHCRWFSVMRLTENTSSGEFTHTPSWVTATSSTWNHILPAPLHSSQSTFNVTCFTVCVNTSNMFPRNDFPILLFVASIEHTQVHETPEITATFCLSPSLSLISWNLHIFLLTVSCCIWYTLNRKTREIQSFFLFLHTNGLTESSRHSFEHKWCLFSCTRVHLRCHVMWDDCASKMKAVREERVKNVH